ncbi:MAG: InlB B-repeat-containing protein, partial [Oscillospiraceae bacterium]|nr:InlB B-repeat-containing protein [Oscillospiraceae bacterium]
MSKFKLFRRRGFALFLSFVMCLSLLPPAAMAEALEPEQTDAVITAGTADDSAMTEDKDVSYEEETGAEDASNEEEATAGDPSHEEETTAGTVSDEEETGAEDVSEEEKTDAEAPSDEEETRAEDVSDKEETGTEDVSTEEETGAEDASNEEETEAGDVPEEETALIAQFHSLLDAMEAFVLTADNQEEYQALGMQAAAVMEALMESYYGWDGMESDLARFQELADKQAGGAEPMAAKWHTVTLVPASTNSYSSKITSAKVKVGDKVNGYEVTSVSGTTIKVKAWGDLYGDFFLPKAADLWNGAVKSDYVIWAGTGSSQKTEGGSAMLPQSNASAYYYFNTAGSVGAGSSGYLWNFTLKYDAKGGSGAPEAQTYGTNSTYEKSHKFTIPSNTPTREDYTFKGWSESSTATSPSYQPNEGCLVSQTVSGYNGGSVTKTLYAVWEKNQPEPEQVTLTYKDRGAVYSKKSHEKGTDVTIKDCTNTRNGYKFLGWDTDPKAETVMYVAGDEMTLREDTTLYAVWEKEESGPVDNGGGIEVTKTRVKINDDTSKTTATVGDTITWEIEVVNNSNVQKTVTLIEELAGVKLSKTEVTLAPGKSETVTATYVVQESDVGTTVYNTIKATTAERAIRKIRKTQTRALLSKRTR